MVPNHQPDTVGLIPTLFQTYGEKMFQSTINHIQTHGVGVGSLPLENHGAERPVPIVVQERGLHSGKHTKNYGKSPFLVVFSG